MAFVKFQELGFQGDNYTFPILFKAASKIPPPGIGFAFHGQTVKTGFSSHLFVQTAQLSMYSAFSDTTSAARMFDGMSAKDVTSWNSMLDVCVRHGEIEAAAKLFDEMLLKDQVSYNTMLSGYASMGMVDPAESIFEASPDRDIMSWNSMIFVHVKVVDMDQAREVFDEMLERDVVSWNTLLSGLLQADYYIEVLDLFRQLKSEGVKPNHLTLTSVISACARMGLLAAGQDMHIHAIELGLVLHSHITAVPIDMYAKSGSIDGALVVFYKTQGRDLYCWNSMISGLAFHGHGKASIIHFHSMQDEGLQPDDITFIGLLSTCSHSGLVEEGCYYFHSMENHGLEPKPEHYGRVIDLLGRDGWLACALELMRSMPLEPSTAVMGVLLSACIIHGNMEVGEAVTKLMVGRKDCLRDGEYMMLVNMYAKCGRWEEASKWREMMNCDGNVTKTVGWSMIEVGGRMHKFLAGAIH